jgi:hypothetical protein
MQLGIHEFTARTLAWCDAFEPVYRSIYDAELTRHVCFAQASCVFETFIVEEVGCSYADPRRR